MSEREPTLQDVLREVQGLGEKVTANGAAIQELGENVAANGAAGGRATGHS